MYVQSRFICRPKRPVFTCGLYPTSPLSASLTEPKVLALIYRYVLTSMKSKSDLTISYSVYGYMYTLQRKLFPSVLVNVAWSVVVVKHCTG